MSTAETSTTANWIDFEGLGDGLGQAARLSYIEADQATLLGLYHGYDQARVALAKLVARYGSDAASDDETQKRIWGRTRRQGLAPDLFEPPCEFASSAGLNQGAHSAALSAFATISQQAEELLEALQARWPDLCEDAGGPLPSPRSYWVD